jgi:hypothetical protein
MDIEKSKNAPAKKILSSQKSAKAIAKAQELAIHSIEQAKTAYKICAALAHERVTLLTPDADSHDVRRLAQNMAEHIAALKDPMDALARAAETGELEFRTGRGEPKASKSLREACKAVLLELEGARLDTAETLRKNLASNAESASSQPNPGPDCDAPSKVVQKN